MVKWGFGDAEAVKDGRENKGETVRAWGVKKGVL